MSWPLPSDITHAIKKLRRQKRTLEGLAKYFIQTYDLRGIDRDKLADKLLGLEDAKVIRRDEGGFYEVLFDYEKDLDGIEKNCNMKGAILFFKKPSKPWGYGKKAKLFKDLKFY